MRLKSINLNSVIKTSLFLLIVLACVPYVKAEDGGPSNVEGKVTMQYADQTIGIKNVLIQKNALCDSSGNCSEVSNFSYITGGNDGTYFMSEGGGKILFQGQEKTGCGDVNGRNSACGANCGQKFHKIYAFLPSNFDFRSNFPNSLNLMKGRWKVHKTGDFATMGEVKVDVNGNEYWYGEFGNGQHYRGLNFEWIPAPLSEQDKPPTPPGGTDPNSNPPGGSAPPGGLTPPSPNPPGAFPPPLPLLDPPVCTQRPDLSSPLQFVAINNQTTDLHGVNRTIKVIVSPDPDKPFSINVPVFYQDRLCQTNPVKIIKLKYEPKSGGSGGPSDPNNPNNPNDPNNPNKPSTPQPCSSATNKKDDCSCEQNSQCFGKVCNTKSGTGVCKTPPSIQVEGGDVHSNRGINIGEE